MTKRQMEALIRDWSYRLGIERYNIVVEWSVEPETYGVKAEIYPNEQYDRARVRFNLAWPTWTPEYAEQVIIHELLHILHAKIDFAVKEITAELPSGSVPMAESWYVNNLESFIDRIALRLYEVTR